MAPPTGTSREQIAELAAGEKEDPLLLSLLCPFFAEKIVQHGQRVEKKLEDAMALAWSRQQSTEVMSLFSVIGGAHGASLLNQVFGMLVSNSFPPLPPTMVAEALACAREARKVAKAAYMLFRPQYLQMFEYVVPCVQNGLD